jgi:CMP-N-acetylneuraminic acid synthetase
MTTHAFVFARGGSKGLPRKNLLPIAGISLVAHSIRLAATIDAIDDIFVSTDSAEIAAEAQAGGATVIDRPAELATDTAPEWLAWRHAVAWVEKRRGPFERFLSLPATAPLRAAEDVEKCLERLTPDTDLVLTVSAARRNPWFNMVTLDPAGQARLVNAGDDVSRRQDAPVVFDVATVAYATRPAYIQQAPGLWSGVVRAVEVPVARAIDIDDVLDFSIARFLKEQAPHLLLSAAPPPHEPG